MLRSIAIRQAELDVRAGRVRLFEAGTIVIYVAGVDPNHPLLDAIPHAQLPNGCTNEDAPFWVVYAEAYNATVIRNLSGPTPAPKRLVRR